MRTIRSTVAVLAVVAGAAGCGGNDDITVPPAPTVADTAAPPAPEEPVDEAPAAEEPADERSWEPVESTVELNPTPITYINYIGIYAETGSPPAPATIYWDTPVLTLTRPDRQRAAQGAAWVIVTADVTMSASERPAPGSWATFVDQDDNSYQVVHDPEQNGLRGWWAAQVPDTTTGGRFEFELGTLTYAGTLGASVPDDGTPLDLSANTFELEVAFPARR